MTDFGERRTEAPKLRRSPLRAATLEGVRWITYGRIATEVTSLVTLAILAHLIPPAQYGHVAIALIVQGLAMALTNEGFGNPLVQRQAIGAAHLESAALMSVAFGLLLGAVTFLLAPLIATPLYGAETTHLIQLAGLLFPVYSLVVVPEAILQRSLDLRRITIVETVGLVAGSLLSIGLAVLGLGGTAVVLGTIATGLVTGLLLRFSVGMPRLRLHRAEAREVTGYGLPASLAGLSSLGVSNVDYVLVGIRLGATRLGIYYRAFALGVANQQKIGLILLRVAFPAYSRAESDEEMRAMRDRMTRLNATVILPLLALLAVGAPKLVPLVLGTRWSAAVVPIQILVVAGFATTMTNCVFPFLFASGRPRWVLALNVFTFFVYGGGVLVALSYGLEAVCVSVVAANAVTMFVAYGLMNRLNVPLRRAWQDSAPAVIGSAGLTVITIPLMAALSRAGLPAPVVLVAIGAVGLSAYVLALRVFCKGALEDALLVLRTVLHRERPSDSALTSAQSAATTLPVPVIAPTGNE